ncbi:MAG: penicillin acylase family protein, partial [Saprospiraceae bacterium]|nr:penicillin acylase family protein [Saprospiraceae bacterium]
ADNYRGVNAVRVLSSKKIFTLDTLIASANDPYLAGFEKLIPDLISSYEHYSGAGTAEKEAIRMLKGWNLSYGEKSISTTLAIQWGEKVRQLAFSKLSPGQRMDAIAFTDFMINNLTPEEKINSFRSTLDDLSRNFGDWKMAWGEINRYQRLTGEVQESYDDSKPSIPVGFTSSMWGSLAAYTSRTFDGTKKRYGIGGNSFVAVVEFGPRLIARSVITGGESSDPGSAHFTDQAELYCKGKFKQVNFYPEDVKAHASRNYHPGDK